MAFARLTKLKRGRVYLPSRLPGEADAGLAVYGQWLRKADIRRNATKESRVVGPDALAVNRRTGAQQTATFVGAPISRKDDEYCLSLSLSQIPSPAVNSDTDVLFIGGWDPHEAQRGQGGIVSRQTGALFAVYPFAADEEIREQMGTIDLPE